MMGRDQAYDLRKLIRRLLPASTPRSDTPPRLISVASGHRGVGTTMVALNLATALSQQGRRVVLVDAHLQQGDVATLCQLANRYTVADILDGHRTIHEVLQPGPAGIQVIPAPPVPSPLSNSVWAGQPRLIAQLQTLGRHADFVLVDVGTLDRDAAGHFLHASSCGVLVTTSDARAITDCYASIKSLRQFLDPAGETLPELCLIVNQADGPLAEDVHRRMDQSCQRFLGLHVAMAGAIPRTSELARAVASGVPLVLHCPTSTAARALDQIAAKLAAALMTQAASPELTAA